MTDKREEDLMEQMLAAQMDANLERLEGLGDDELARELAAKGVDADKGHDATLRALEAARAKHLGSPAAKPRGAPGVVRLDERRPARTARAWTTALLVAAAAAVLLYVWSQRDVNDPTKVSAGEDAKGPRSPRDLRADAWDDYRAGRYGEALRKLDEARTENPALEEPPDTQKLRAALVAAMASEAGR